MSKAKQARLELTDTTPVEKVEEYQFEPIKGYPKLTWRGNSKKVAGKVRTADGFV